MPKRFQGKVALVTGAARRVGRCIALHLADLGADVVVHHRGPATDRQAGEVAEGVRSRGGRALVVAADHSDPNEVSRAFAEVGRVFGRLDLLVNNASSFERIPWAELDLDGLRRSVAANLEGPFLCSKAAEPLLADGGAIVHIGDGLAFEAVPAYVAHAASKAALVSLMRSMARALAPRLRVAAVVPGTVLPPDGWPDDLVQAEVRRTPLGRIGRPEDVAEAVAYLFGAPFVTGAVLEVDGGRALTRG